MSLYKQQRALPKVILSYLESVIGALEQGVLKP